MILILADDAGVEESVSDRWPRCDLGRIDDFSASDKGGIGLLS